MTLQELINKLQYSIDECGFYPDAIVVVDLIHYTDGYSQYSLDDVDNTGSHMGILSLNVYLPKEDE